MSTFCLLSLFCVLAATNPSSRRSDVLIEGEYVTEILFRQKGTLSGAVTYGHLTFENDLTEVDDSHVEAENIIENYSKKLMEKMEIEILKASYNVAPHPWFFYGGYWDTFIGFIDEYIKPSLPHQEEYLEKLQAEEDKLKNNITVEPTPVSRHFENFKKSYLANPAVENMAKTVEIISYYETACLYNRGIFLLVADRVHSSVPYAELVQQYDAGIPVTKMGKLKQQKIELNEILANGNKQLDEIKSEWRNYKKAIGLEDVSVPQPQLEISKKESEVEEFNPKNPEKLRTREKRIAPILIAIGVGIGVAAGATGIVTSSIAIAKMNAIEEIARHNIEQDGKLEVIVANLQKNNEEAAATEVKLHDLNFTMTWAAKELLDLDKTDQLLHVETNINQILNTISKEQQRVIKGTTDVLHKQLSPEWVKVTDIMTSLTDLRSKAIKEGFDLPITEVTWLYKNPCGCLVHKNGKFITFVAIPLHIQNQQLELFEYVKIPVSLNESVHSVTIEPEGTYLGVNPDRDGFLILQEKEVENCPKIGDIYLCENRNYLHKIPERFCLSALFWRLQTAAHTNCKTALATDNTKIVQTAQHSFYIFHPQEYTLTIQCPNKAESYFTWRGSRLVDLKIGCRGFGIDYDLVAYPSFAIENIIETSNISWTVRQLTLDLSKKVIETYMPTPPKHSVMVEDLVSQVRMIEQNSARLIGNNYYPMSFASSSVGGILTLVAITMTLCCCCYCCRGPILNKIRNFGTNLLDKHEQPTYQPLPAARRIRRPQYPSLPDYLDLDEPYLQLRPLRNPANAEAQTTREGSVIRVV